VDRWLSEVKLDTIDMTSAVKETIANPEAGEQELTVIHRVKYVITAFVIGLMGFVASSGHAQEQSAFEQLLASQALQQQVIQAAGHSTVILQNPCPSAQYTLDNKPFVRTAPVFDSSGHVVNGDWKQVVSAKGCGRTRLLNVLVLVRAPNSLATIPMLPGTTHAGPVLQKDAVKYAVQIVATVPGGNDPNCKTGYIEDTEFVSQESTPVQGGKEPPWREVWTLVSCVQKMQVPMLFIPDSTGTSISAGPNKAVKVIPLDPSVSGLP
jgi:hypothetical protein